ncbi:unnamed protein product [Closterium sp. Yama58-4]|nr:unnamed protein product [Closterium sp. Yama58-4]
MFGELAADETRKCQCCPTRISFKLSNTRSGGWHYEEQHNAHYAIWKRMVPHGGEEWPYAEAYPNFPPEALVGGVAALGGGQATMEQFMTPRVSVRELQAAIVKFIVMIDSSYRIVDSDAVRIEPFSCFVLRFALRYVILLFFKEMLTVANSACGKDKVIPSRWTVARGVSMYADMARALARAELELEKEEDLLMFKVCFTSDIWSSEARRCYMHGGLVGRCHGITTDNASGNVAAIKQLSDDGDRFLLISQDMWFRCFAHVINLAVQKALKVDKVKVPLQRIRDMAKCVGLSSKRMARFRKELKDSFPTMRDVKLVLDCETRWGSSFAMVARALRLRRPSSSHFSQVQVALKAFLAPFNTITKAAEGSVYPTVATIVLYYNLLLDTLEKTLEDASTPPFDLLRDLIQAALPVLQKFYDNSTDELTVATFLDPGLKLA